MVRYDKLERILARNNMNRTGLSIALGISSRTIAKIGRGEKLSPIILGKISSYFNCRPEDLYDEIPDDSALSFSGSTASSFDLDGNEFNSENAVYIIDKQFRIVDFNDIMRRYYPHLKKGDYCFSSLMRQSEVCKSCPLKMDSDEDLPFYNPISKHWLSIRRATIDYPGVGKCGLLTCRRNMDMHKSIRSRLPLLSGYDVYIEMNLTKNLYRIILPNDPAQEKDFSRDKLEEFIKRTADSLVHPNDREAFLEFWDINTLVSRINGPEHEIHGVFRECRKSGVWDTVYITIVPEEYYGTNDVVIMALYMIMPGRTSDTAYEPAEENMYAKEDKINCDYMTGLPLRRSFWSLIDKRHLQDNNAGGNYCVLAMDIEHFHIINNWYGRAAGDILLANIGAALKESEKSGKTTSGYMGGDNFCTIFRYNEETLKNLVGKLTEIVHSFKSEADFHAVFGACLVDFSHIAPQDAYDLAVMAMKRSDSPDENGICWYDEQMIEEQQAEERLLLQFQKDIENGEITFYLQPKCDIKTGKIVGAEALARWNSSTLGTVSPATFIPVLENAGKISRLDYYIWESVCATISKWRKAGLPILPISVNVSRIDVFSMDIVYAFTTLIEKYGLKTSDIEIEITESAYAENDTIIKEVQGGLRAAGFNMLIDDFGSGYSSLNFLKDIDSDAIKLDLNFLELNDKNFEKGANILTSILSMANKLNMVTIAEGVETREQLDFLTYNGCLLAQGYYFYKPMPVENYERLVSDPGLIIEGMHLTSFRPDPQDSSKTDMKAFSGFDENLAFFMKTLMDVASVVRIVDVHNHHEYRINKDGHLSRLASHCYDIWGRKKECKDCISVIAVEKRESVSKYETLGKDTYYIIAKPVLIAGNIYSMETAIKIS